MKRVDDFRLRLGNKEYVPIMIGGMGVDISTSELALEAARLGGIGHISDAMVQDVSDRKFDTSFVKEKTKLYKFNINNMDKAVVQFDLDRLAEATAPARGRDHGSEERRWPDLRQLHGKADHERAQGNLAHAPVGRARRRHRRHHHVGRPAPGFLRADRRPPALPRRQAGHHRVLGARAATVPAQGVAPGPPARLHHRRRPAGRRPPRLRHRTGKNTTCTRSWTRSMPSCAPNSSTFR